MEEWDSLKAGAKGSNEYQRWVAAHEKMAESGENATILHKDRDFFCGLRAFWQRALVNMNIC